MSNELRAELVSTIAALDLDELAELIADNIDGDSALARDQLQTYLNESLIALDLVAVHLESGESTSGFRVLEIGSGIGFFAAFLHSHGYDVVELEPVGGGFEFIGAARHALRSDSAPTHLDIGVDDLDPDLHGRFDLIYSLNVLEHVPDWRHALDASYDVLAPGGTMVQSCPNYTFPYEPHFGVPLIPFAPQVTSRVLPERITSTGLWKSLNWVTVRGVRNWAQGRDARITFASGKLASALERLTTDADFGDRHSRALRVVAAGMSKVGMIELLRKIPPALTSPMDFAVTRP